MDDQQYRKSLPQQVWIYSRADDWKVTTRVARVATNSNTEVRDE